VDVGLDSADRAVDDERNAHRRRKVVDDVRFVDELGHDPGVAR
jgi:hypothetical protein